MVVIGIDTGGTFTDFVYFDGESKKVFKVLSTPDNPAKAVLTGLSHIGGSEDRDIVHGSTVATNAILERKGARTAIITNKGFEDIIEIGRQNREKLYDLKYRKPSPIVPEELRFGVRCRTLCNGEVIEELDYDQVIEVIRRVKKAGAVSVAVSLLFSFLNPDHECIIGDVLEKEGIYSSLSHRILPEFREYERTSTTVLNAYVGPIMKNYITDFSNRLRPGDRLRIMQSNGGSISADIAISESIRTILSGPAGGVIGAYEVARAAGFTKIITFDMGGTSTDVSLVNGRVTLTTESKIGGFPVKVPMIDIHTVGAGGGSIAYIDRGGSLKVGPRSAGASPGPICYGQGGEEITVTDANLFLGHLIPRHFLGGEMNLEREKLQPFFDNMAGKLGMNPVELAQGILSVANATMERAIRVISVERGENPEEFVLFAFGGAGGLHAAFLAKSLSISRVMVPENPGTLSALGMLVADIVKDYSKTIMMKGSDSSIEELSIAFDDLEKKGTEELAGEGVREDCILFERFLDMRYLGQSHEIMVPFTHEYISSFHQYHEKLFGYKKKGNEVEIVNVRLRCRGKVTKPEFAKNEVEQKEVRREAFVGEEEVYFEDTHSLKTLILDRVMLDPGNEINGPAIIVEYTSTTVVPPGWMCEVDAYKNLVISQC